MLRESVPEKGSRRVFLQKRGVHHAVLGSQRLIIWILQREAGSLQTPQALELHHWGSGFRTPWRFLPGAGGVGLGFLGKTSPWGTRSPWVPFPIRGGGQGLCPHRDPGIAGSPDGNPAFDRQCPQGLFPWEHRAVRPVGSGGRCGLKAGSHLWYPPSSPFLVLGPGVLHNGGSGRALLGVQGSAVSET